jgi:hypothetical protein
MEWASGAALTATRAAGHGALSAASGFRSAQLSALVDRPSGRRDIKVECLVVCIVVLRPKSLFVLCVATHRIERPLGLLLVPAGERSPLLLLAAFLLHRLFDIWKPFPCRQLDQGHGGLGIMADDWGAAAWMALGLAVGRQAGWW